MVDRVLEEGAKVVVHHPPALARLAAPSGRVVSMTVESPAEEAASATSAGKYMATTRARQASSDCGGPLRKSRAVGCRATSRWEAGTHPALRTKCRGRACFRQRFGPMRQRRSARGDHLREERQSPRRIKKLLHSSGGRRQGNLGALAESLERIRWRCRHRCRGGNQGKG